MGPGDDDFTGSKGPMACAAATRRPTPHRRWPAKALALAAAGLLASCAPMPQIKTYQPSAGAPQARLLMRGAIGPGETYGIYILSDPYACKGLQRVGIGTSQANPPATTFDARGLATMDVLFSKPDKTYCHVRWSFYPQEKKSYLIVAQQTGKECRAGVMDATDPDDIKPEATAVRRNVAGNMCVPMEQAQKLKQAARDAAAAAKGKEAAKAAPTDKAAPQLLDNASDEDLKNLIGK